MRNRLDLLMTAFARHHDGVHVADGIEAGQVLLVDERWVVNLIDDPGGSIRALAHLGRFAPARAIESGDPWAHQTRSADNFTWTIACHHPSGTAAITASLSDSADVDSMDRWLGSFVERLRQAGRALSDERDRPNAHAQSQQEITAVDQPLGWLRA